MKGQKQTKYIYKNLISFEGIEGAGKTTQIQLFQEELTKNGFSVHYFREPGGTQIGEKLRELILNAKEALHPMTECYIFMAARNELLHKKILPLLEKNDPKDIIILDRYLDSTVAYQGFARELGAQSILALHQEGLLQIRPGLTFYLKIDLDTSLARQSKRGGEKDYFEQEKSSFYLKLIEGYNYMAQYDQNRIQVINAMQDENLVFQEIKKNWHVYQNGVKN